MMIERITTEANMNKFYATLEFIAGQSAAIVELTDQHGEWSGGGRIEGRSKAIICEKAYIHASLSAQSKGGRLERFSQVSQ